RVDGSKYLLVLIRPSGIIDKPVDRFRHFSFGLLTCISEGLQFFGKLSFPSLQHFGDTIENLSPVIGRAAGPPALGFARLDYSITDILAGTLTGIRQDILISVINLIIPAGFGARKLSADISFICFEHFYSI